MDNARRLGDFARIGSDWLWETDAEDRYSYFVAEETRGGADLVNPVGRHHRDIAVDLPENLARLDELAGIVAGRASFRDFLFQVRARNGERRWCMISGAPCLDAAGRFAGYRGVGRDVTQEVEEKHTLEVQARALEAILGAIPDGVQVIDENGRTLAVNDRIFEMMGIPNRRGAPEPEITFQSVIDMAKRGEYGLGDPEKIALERVETMLRSLHDQGHITYQRQLKTGTWIEARLHSIEGGGFLSLYRDITEAKVREAELERQAGLLQTIFDNFPGGISVYDPQGRLVAWNDRYADIIGAPKNVIHQGAAARDILIAQAHDGEFGPVDDPVEAGDRRWRALVAGRMDNMVRERRDGHAFDMRRRTLPDGGTVSIYLDTTERRRAERALQEANANLEKRIAERTAELADRERFLRNIIGNVPGMVYRARSDRDRTMVFASDGCRELLGLSPEQLMQDGTITLGSLIHPDEQRQVWEKVRLEYGAGDGFQLEYRLRRADGTWRWVQDRARAIRSDSGEVVMVEGLIFDIEARRQAEQKLEKTHETLLDAIESIDNNLIIYDRDDRLVLYTKHLADQYPNADRFFVIGRKFEDILRDAVYSEALPVPAGMDKDSLLVERIGQYRRADGKPLVRHLQNGRILQISEHRSLSGGTVSIGRDITEQAKMEAQLRESQRMEAIGKLTGGLAHDLNNYLAVIMGNLDLLAGRPHVDPGAQKLIRGALAGVRRGAELTRSLLAFSRRQPLDPRVIDLGARISSVSRLIARTMGEKISLDLEIDPELWLVKIDGAQLDAALVNLANNARDAMPQGGSLRIVVGNAPARADRSPPGDHVVIAVTDSGTGMSAETAAMAFEPFFTTKGPGHGTGLGLSMVHGFVHQSGGAIQLDSTPGKGTTVRIFLPRTLEASEQDGTKGARPTLPGGSERILVVEDNEFVRETVVEQLKSLGYTVTDVDSGDAAAMLLESSSAEFDLVFTDMIMPGRVDGVALARLATARWPSLRVLITSGFSGADPDGEEQGPTILRKPYRKADLARAVRVALGRSAVG